MPEKPATNRPSARREKSRPAPQILQFLIVLSNTNPLVWRRIEVPGNYSFWDLHVAIQDSMGWLDYHLHEFHVFHPKKRKLELLGIPDGDSRDERSCIPDWKAPIAEYFTYEALRDSPSALYLYDFGDDWHHSVTFEDVSPPELGIKYPRCVAGARACPPEDCGGVGGYMEFLEAISDPEHPEHDEMVTWSGGSYDPDKFDPRKISFDDPRRRWKKAFQEGPVK